jgi:hypothetical protein
MGQEEIRDFLRKYQLRWFNSNELTKALGISKASMNRCLQKMKRHNEINEKMIKIMFKGKLGSLISKEVPFYSYKRV